MQPAQENQRKDCSQPLWTPVVKYAVSEDIRDEDIEAVIVAEMFQTIEQLGLPDEHLRKIERSITETARKSRRQCSPGTSSSAVQIHLFCQRVPPQGDLHCGEKQVSTGWSYYLIERGDNSSITSCERYDRIIDLYLYREGE